MENNGMSNAKMTFWIALVVMLIFVIIGVAAPAAFGEAADAAFNYMVEQWGWAFIFGASIFLFLIVFLLLSPVGEIRLGADDEKPAYSNMAWFAMLFSCGMGIGLLFWGVSEPIWHYMWPPYGEAYTADSVHVAMQYSFFHWGFHPWAIYAVVAGSLAYFSYRKGLPMLLSSCLEPILGRKGIEGPWGMLINIIGVFATLFGLATSLGLGAMQIGAGLEQIFGIASTPTLWVTIVIVTTLAAIISTSTGIDRGIKYLSQLNIVVAILLMLLVFIVGPTLFILNLLTQSTGDYLQNIIQMSFGLDAAGAGTEGWYNAWTVFYWAWWIAWAPFVGTFIARISKGRTIRQFIAGVLIAPTIMSFFWFSIFGTVGINVYDRIGAFTTETAFFQVFEHYPLGTLLSGVAVLLLTTFFITSANSATFVMGMLSEGGNLNPGTPKKIIWGLVTAGLAAVLLLAGGLGALQTGSIVAAFPFAFVMIAAMFSLVKALKGDAAFMAGQQDVSDEKPVQSKEPSVVPVPSLGENTP